MIRALALLALVVWILAVVGRVTRTVARMPATVRGAEPPPGPQPEGALVAATKVVLGLLLVLVASAVLLAATSLPVVAVVLGVAPVAGLVSSAVTDRWLTTDD